MIFTATADLMKGYWLNEYFPDAMKKSICQMPSRSKIVGALKNTGFRKAEFESYEVKDDLEDIFLYSGKNHPEMYLDEGIRMNISTFAAVAEPDEVKRGCSLLQRDICSGRIINVIEAYNTRNTGDYVFIIGQK